MNDDGAFSRSNPHSAITSGASLRSSRNPQSVAPYTALAAGYDVVMAHVDYAYWAVFAQGLLRAHHPGARSLLELGCGTGSLALTLQPLGPYTYTATDGSAAMIRIARQKAAHAGVSVEFGVATFAEVRAEAPVDVVLLLYDGLNYLLEADAVQALLHGAYDALRPGGLFLFDQSTPANSINNAAFFEDEGDTSDFAYVRHSRYDPSTRLHTTTFTLAVDGEPYQEQHVQRAYALQEIRALVQATPFQEVAAYNDFTVDPATEASERIHWVLRRPVG